MFFISSAVNSPSTLRWKSFRSFPDSFRVLLSTIASSQTSHLYVTYPGTVVDSPLYSNTLSFTCFLNVPFPQTGHTSAFISEITSFVSLKLNKYCFFPICIQLKFYIQIIILISNLINILPKLRIMVDSHRFIKMLTSELINYVKHGLNDHIAKGCSPCNSLFSDSSCLLSAEKLFKLLKVVVGLSLFHRDNFSTNTVM